MGEGDDRECASAVSGGSESGTCEVVGDGAESSESSSSSDS